MSALVQVLGQVVDVTFHAPEVWVEEVRDETDSHPRATVDGGLGLKSGVALAVTYRQMLSIRVLHGTYWMATRLLLAFGLGYC